MASAAAVPAATSCSAVDKAGAAGRLRSDVRRRCCAQAGGRPEAAAGERDAAQPGAQPAARGLQGQLLHRPKPSEQQPVVPERFEQLLAEAEQCIRARSASPNMRGQQHPHGAASPLRRPATPAGPGPRTGPAPAAAAAAAGCALESGAASSGDCCASDKSPLPHSLQHHVAALAQQQESAPPPLLLPPAAAPLAAQPIAGAMLPG